MFSYFCKKYITDMELRIKELAKQRGMTIGDIAKERGISRVNLSNSINGNPTLGRLKEVAAILQVEVSELFKKTETKQICGFLEYNGAVTKIESLEALKGFIRRVEEE